MNEIITWISKFSNCLKKNDDFGLKDLFHEDSFWRDIVSFTWNIKTAEGSDEILEMINKRLVNTNPNKWVIRDNLELKNDVIGCSFDFQTDTFKGEGVIRLKHGKCWTLFTSALELKGFEEKKNYSRPLGVEHGIKKSRKSWLEIKEEEESTLGYTQQPYCLIIGGGQGGVILAARLRKLNVPTIVIDKNKNPGDSWRNRYKSLCLHDVVWQNHLPYLPFPDDWPVFIPKDKMGDWLESYSKIMELNYWVDTECVTAKYNQKSQDWNVKVMRGDKSIELVPKQLVFATGMSGVPNIPEVSGAHHFEGDIHHSSKHKDGSKYEGKNCIILGSNNSAHDISANLWENGANVTMVQRSPSMVVKSESLFRNSPYSESSEQKGISTHEIDMLDASLPWKLNAESSIEEWSAIQKNDSAFYEGLRKSGFLLEFGEDGAGLATKYHRRGSGYYIDVGASELIINGDIKIFSGVTISKIGKNSIILSNGEEIEADLIVYATGYKSMNSWISHLISEDMAKKVGKCWGLGSDTKYDPGPWEGELRNMWKPTQQPNLWFQGGNLQQARYYSIALSLQIKARMEGLTTPIYGLEKVNHNF